MLRVCLQMLSYGCTRLEIGLQSTYEDVARDTNRGHTVAAVGECFRMAKDAGFKVGVAMGHLAVCWAVVPLHACRLWCHCKGPCPCAYSLGWTLAESAGIVFQSLHCDPLAPQAV